MNGKVGHMEVSNLRDAYNTVDVCWRFYEEDGSTIAFGNQSGLSAQRFDATNDLSNVQEYIEIIVGGTCGEAWLADNIMQDPAGGDPPLSDETSGTDTATSTWAIGHFMSVLLAVTGTSMLFV
jgi:hypothetical protein